MEIGAIATSKLSLPPAGTSLSTQTKLLIWLASFNPMSLTEPEVIIKTHRFLKAEPLADQATSRIFTDAHSSLLTHQALQPFQRFTLDLGDFVLYPDLVGQLSDGETLFAVEAKGSTDIIKGLAQAEMYQAGFHYSFLAAESTALTPSHIKFARRKNIGIIAVSDTVTIAHTPEAQMPFRDPYRFIARQMETVVQVATGQTFYYNAPTHYLVWAILLEPNVTYSMNSLPAALADYPMPEGKRGDGWKSALTGARKLKIVATSGKELWLTPVGEAIKVILPDSIHDWAKTHQYAGARGTKLALAKYNPQAGAALRLLLLDDPMVRLIIEGLTRLGKAVTFRELAIMCDSLDHARAPIFFLNPNSADKVIDNKGRICWDVVTKDDYRSTNFYQFKRVLRHAGILSDRSLGGPSTKDYKPEKDLWELR